MDAHQGQQVLAALERVLAALERVERMCSRWEQSETWNGQPDIVGRAFAQELRAALRGESEETS